MKLEQTCFTYHLASFRYWLGMAGKPNGGYVSQPKEVGWHQSQAIGWASR